MARLTAAERKRLPLSEFAVPSKAPGPGSYPMPDKAHAAVAKGMAARHASPSVEAKVDTKANAKLGHEGHMLHNTEKHGGMEHDIAKGDHGTTGHAGGKVGRHETGHVFNHPGRGDKG